MSESIGEWVSINDLNPWQDNPRQNSEAISEVAKSIKRFGFASPIIARKADNMIIAGHTRFEAAKEIGLKKVPVRFMELDLNDAQLLALADNKLGEIALWDEEKLKDILMNLEDTEILNFEFELDEILENLEVEKPEVEFSEFIGEEHNYIVLLFDNDIDWLSAQEHFSIKSKCSPDTNGKIWSKGIGRVINGAKYIEEITK